MKIMHLPDPHCYYTVYESIDRETGRSVRQIEWERLAAYMVEKAKELSPDLIIAPGDFFRNARPESDQVFMMASFLEALEETGATVVGFLGNHDTRPPDKKTSADLFAAMGRKPLWNIASPRVVSGDGYDLAVLPSIHSSQIYSREKDPADAAHAVSQRLIQVMKALRQQCHSDTVKILAGHWTISGAKASSGQTILEEREPVIPLHEILDCKWDLACFGHIHKPQKLSESPFVGYAGAMQRIDVGEEKDGRGFWLHDTDLGTSEWHPIPALEFLTIAMERAEAQRVCDDPEAFGEILGRFDASGRFVRVRYEVTEEEAARIRPDSIASMVTAAGALAVIDVRADIIRESRARNVTVTEKTSVMEAFDSWLADRGDLSDGLKEKVRRIAVDALSKTMSEQQDGPEMEGGM